MAKRKNVSAADETTRLLKDILIVQLGLAGVGQTEIRSIVGADMGRVNSIVKLVRKKENNKKRKPKIKKEEI